MILKEQKIRILGIDPGLKNTGWGIIDSIKGQCSFVSCGSIITDSQENLALRLLLIYDSIQEIATSFGVEQLSIEDTYVNINSKSSLYLAHARAAALLAGAKSDLIAVNYQAKTIKKAVTGSGNAEKDQVAKMLKLRLTGFEMIKNKDAIDAISIAFCHAHYTKDY